MQRGNPATRRAMVDSAMGVYFLGAKYGSASPTRSSSYFRFLFLPLFCVLWPLEGEVLGICAEGI